MAEARQLVCVVPCQCIQHNHMDFRGNPKLREEGIRAAREAISVIQGSGDERYNDHLMGVYTALGMLLAAGETKEDYDMALHYYEKVRDHWKSVGGELQAAGIDDFIDNLKCKLDGKEGRMYSEEKLKYARDSYNYVVKKMGKIPPMYCIRGCF